APIVSGNDSAAGVANNIYLANGRVINVTGDMTGANVGVYTQSLPVGDNAITIAKGVKSYTANATDAAAFHSDNAGEASVQLLGERIVLVEAVNEVYVAASGDDATGTGTMYRPYKTLAKAYAQVSNDGEIRVLSDLDELTANTNFNSNKTVTIASYTKTDDTAAPAASAHTVKRATAWTGGSTFIISAGKVILNNITLDGGATWTTPENLQSRTVTNTTPHQLIQVIGGELVLDNKATLQNHARAGGSVDTATYDTSGDRGSAVYVKNAGKLTMNTGATIQNCDVTSTIGDGAAVSIWGNGAFYMNGGSITGNTSSRMGGAIRVAESGSHMYLYGGTISGNATKSVDNCGGISVNAGTLHLKGAPVVKDNLQNTTECNILYNAKIVMDGRLTGGSIGVTGVAGDVTTATATYNDLQYFHSDNIALAAQF
ncbi:MAG: hypothetical protein RSB55_09695, partial [Oscillospiraceae bacterium]